MRKNTPIVIFYICIFICACSKCENDNQNVVQRERKDNSNAKEGIIKIGSIQQLTGDMAKYGKTHVAAVRAQIEIINEQRKAKKLPLLKLLIEDDQLQPRKGLLLLKKLIDMDNIQVVLGAQGSSVTMAMAPVSNEKKVVQISGGSTAPQVSQAGEFVFRTCPSDIYEGKMMARYYKSHYNKGSLAVLYINNDYGVGLRDAFLGEVGDRRDDALILAYNQGVKDFRTQLTRIKNSKIDIVYLVGYEDMVSVFKQAKELALKVQWLGNGQLSDESLVAKIGDTANGTIFPGHEFDSEKIKKLHPDFYNRFLRLSGELDLDVFAAYGADAIVLINHVMIQGAKSGTQIRDALLKIQNYPVITGNITFDDNGDAERTLNMYTIQDGKMLPMESSK